MKKSFYFVIALLLGLFTACSSSDEDIQTIENNKGFTFNAVLPQSSSTRAVAADGADGVSFTWSAASSDRDRVSFNYLYDSGSGNTWRSKDNYLPTISGSTATFTLNYTPVADTYVYGCNNTNASSINGDATASYALFLLDPREMIYKDLDDLGKYNPMIGVVQASSTTIPNTMMFKNVCALLKFTITLPVNDNISNIKISDYTSKAQGFTYGRWAVKYENNGEFALYGSSGDKPVDGNTKNASAPLQKNVTWATEAGAITFYALILPQSISGINLTVTATNEATNTTYTYTKHTSLSKTLEASKMYTITLGSTGWEVKTVENS